MVVFILIGGDVPCVFADTLCTGARKVVFQDPMEYAKKVRFNKCSLLNICSVGKPRERSSLLGKTFCPLPPWGMLWVIASPYTRRCSMKRKWNVRRSWREQPDGQHRWDSAYQCLLQWVQEGASEPHPLPLSPQEDSHERGHLCPRVDASPTTEPDD